MRMTPISTVALLSTFLPSATEVPSVNFHLSRLTPDCSTQLDPDLFIFVFEKELLSHFDRSR